MDKNKHITSGGILLWCLSIVGVILILYRFANGIGSVSNLSDDTPWGLWIGIDILAGIALASGGFVMAGTVHLFGKDKFHALARPAILTALLGYILFICGLIIDLGRPWNLLNIIITGNHSSPLYEVGWCVMFYTLVLIFEFMPVIFEKIQMKAAHKTWQNLVPWFIIIMLTVFMFAMTHSVNWAIFMAFISLFWEVCMRLGFMPRDKQMPILLIMSGVIFSTLHQSSLGTIYLMAPHDLHILWYSPLLPVLFFLSAVMVGPAMVIFEAYCSEKFLGHKANYDLLYDFSRIIPYLLQLYLIVMMVGIVQRGAISEIFKVTPQTFSWWLEVIIGIIIPMFLFLSFNYIKRRRGLFLASALVVLGLIWNRVNVSIIGIKAFDEIKPYYPMWSEVFITVGLFSMGMLVYKWITNNMPVSEHA